MARRPHVRTARGPRRQTVWFAFALSEFLIGAGGTAQLLFQLNAAALALRPFTVIRSRFDWFCHSDQDGADEQWGGALAMAVVSDQASAIGITALPTPVTDQGSDLFFVYEQMVGEIIVTSAVGVTEVGRNKVIDSKAMRKVDIGQDIVVVAETPTFVESADFVLGGRMLVKLH